MTPQTAAAAVAGQSPSIPSVVDPVTGVENQLTASIGQLDPTGQTLTLKVDGWNQVMATAAAAMRRAPRAN